MNDAKRLKIMLVGGGSGGHLTPLVAVADALKKQVADVEIVYVGKKGENLQEAVGHPAIDSHFAVSAGKFRRYHGKSFLSHILDIKTLFLNMVDFFRFLAGIVQSWWLLGRLKPDSIFLKGGFVSVPVGLAARARKIPYITHDSDAVPGLANRLTAKQAAFNTTAMPVDLYSYDKSKTIQVGIPLQPEFQKVTPEIQSQAKAQLGYQPTDRILFCVGGGLGSQNINKALAAGAAHLFQDLPHLHILHITGKKLYVETEKLYKQALGPELLPRVKLIDFTTELFRYSTAADLIISRAGATNIAEFSAQAKACIVIPAPQLTGGQQLHNAKVLEQANAAIILREEELSKLVETVQTALHKPDLYMAELGDKLHSLFVPGAAEKIAELLVSIVSV